MKNTCYNFINKLCDIHTKNDGIVTGYIDIVVDDKDDISDEQYILLSSISTKCIKVFIRDIEKIDCKD